MWFRRKRKVVKLPLRINHEYLIDMGDRKIPCFLTHTLVSRTSGHADTVALEFTDKAGYLREMMLPDDYTRQIQFPEGFSSETLMEDHKDWSYDVQQQVNDYGKGEAEPFA